MKKQLISFAAALTAAITSIPAVAVNAAEPIAEYKVTSGDANTDGIFSMSDLIATQKYILGSGKLTEAGLKNADVNLDGRVDAFDFPIMRSDIINDSKPVTQNIRRAFNKLPDNFIKQDIDSGVITSAALLKAYFTGLECVGDSQEEEIRIPSIGEDVLAEMLETYNDDFFRENVLLLNYSNRLNPGEVIYFDSISYKDNWLNIRYDISSDESSAEDGSASSLSPVILEVTVPRKLFHNDTIVSWGHPGNEENIRICTDRISAVTEKGFRDIIVGMEPVVIRNTEELNAFTADVFREGLRGAAARVYDEKFFEDNNLIIELFAKNEDDLFHEVVTLEETEDGIFKFDHKKVDEEYDSDCVQVETNVIMTQAILPKSKEIKGTVGTSIERVTTEDGIKFSRSDNNEAYFSGYRFDSWVESDEELRCGYFYLDSKENYDKWIERHFVYLGDELANENDFFGKYFGDIDWDKEDVYVWSENQPGGSYKDFLSSEIDRTDPENVVLHLNMIESEGTGCIPSENINILRLPKSFSEMDIIERKFDFGCTRPFVKGDTLFLPDDYVLVNQYTFKGKNAADFYGLHFILPGMAAVSWRYCYDYNYKGSIQLPDNCLPFVSDCEYTTESDIRDEKNYTKYTSDKFTYENVRDMSGDTITIILKPDKGSETITETIEYRYD